ncbi:MAG: hypothetical protein K6G56_08015 [Clostridiales bacterium]|nr:hypothetical protein [Clostridiales bacterium]
MQKKEPPRVAVRLTGSEKKKIATAAAKCGLTVIEYMRQRALGYEPKAVQPDAYFVLCEKLDRLTEPPFSEAINDAAIKLIS